MEHKTPENEKKSKWAKIIKWVILCLLTVGIAYLVYYFFFADDCEDLDEDFFGEPEEEAAQETEEPAQETEKPAEEAASEETPADEEKKATEA